jgi:TonB family protein
MRRPAIHIVSVCLTRTTVLWLLLLPAVPRASAQQTAIETAAVQLTDAIVHSKQKTVAILDFSGPGDKVTELGEKLANDLSAAMAKSGTKFQMLDRSRVEKERQQNSRSLDIVLDPEYSRRFARGLGAKALVMGAISPGPDNQLNITLNAYRTDNGNGIKALRIGFPLSDEMAGLMAKYVTTNSSTTDPASYPVSGSLGYSTPKCLFCPRADYTPQAEQKRIEGFVELNAIVGIDGRLSDIKVVKELPAGLTEQAIAAVKKWKLVPAEGPDGKPAAVRQTIMVEFRQR